MLRVALGITVLLLVLNGLFMLTCISGASMFPTLREGQFAIVFTQAYQFGAPKRGDVVVVSTPNDLIVKRVVGLPGESLAIHSSNVYVDGQPLLEPYLKCKGSWEVGPGRIGAGRYAVVGDNRSGSQANALLAVVDQNRILGKLVCAIP